MDELQPARGAISPDGRLIAINSQPLSVWELSTGKKRFELVSRDKFFLLIGALDEKFSETETRKLLESIGGAHIEIIED